MLFRSNRTKEEWADIDVQLKRRYDLIPNLVNTVKGYAKHEKGTFEKVTEMRAKAMSAEGAQERGQAHDFQARLGGGRYLWTVQVVQGHFINNSGHPDDWILESFRSPESEPRMIIVHEERDDDEGRPGSTKNGRFINFAKCRQRPLSCFRTG